MHVTLTTCYGNAYI